MAPKLYKGGKFSKGLEAANEEKRRTKLGNLFILILIKLLFIICYLY